MYYLCTVEAEIYFFLERNLKVPEDVFVFEEELDLPRFINFEFFLGFSAFFSLTSFLVRGGLSFLRAGTP